jgi:serine/threonine protein kinase
VLQILEQICEGMQYAHEKGIIHRDLKPSNIIISRTAHGAPLVKIVDFGIAKMTREVCSDQQITRTGEVFGSPLYMSPEQCHGHREMDVRSDIYSMGCVTYEALTGNPPFHGGTAMQTMYKHINERPARFSIVDEPELCALEKVVMQALEKNPERRYQSMSEMRRDIRAIRTGTFQPAECSPLETLKQRCADSAINVKEAIGLLLLAASLWFSGDSQIRVYASRAHFLKSCKPPKEKLPRAIFVSALIGLVIGIFIPPPHIPMPPFQDKSNGLPNHKRAVHHSIAKRHQTAHK